MLFSKFRLSRNLLVYTSRNFSTTQKRNVKVAVLGASGHIGQPLSLLLKQSPLIQHLAMYDVVHSPGVAADLSHIQTPCQVKGYGPGQLQDALSGTDVVIVAAGVARKQGQTREDQFIINSRIVKDLATNCAQFLPNAIYGIITNPINSTVPLFCEVFRKFGTLNENKIMGITTLNVVRTNSFIAEERHLDDPTTVNCPVIGGHSGITIIPLLSQCKDAQELSEDRQKHVVLRVREAGHDIVEAKQGSGTVTLSMAWSAAKFTNSVIRALNGEDNIIECAYVKSNVTESKYFANPLKIGPNGVEKNLGMGTITPYEKELLRECIPVLARYIEQGEEVAAARI